MPARKGRLGWREFLKVLPRAPASAWALAALLAAGPAVFVWRLLQERARLRAQAGELLRSHDELLTRSRMLQDEYVRLKAAAEPLEALALSRFPDKTSAEAFTELAVEMSPKVSVPKPGGSVSIRRLAPWLRTPILLELARLREKHLPGRHTISVIVGSSAGADADSFALGSELIALLLEAGLGARMGAAQAVPPVPGEQWLLACSARDQPMAADLLVVLGRYLGQGGVYAVERLAPGQLELILTHHPVGGPDGTVRFEAPR